MTSPAPLPYPFSRALALGVSLLIATVVFFPTLYAGLTGDDLYRSAFSIIPTVDGRSAAASASAIAAQYDREMGGYTPLFHVLLRYWETGPTPAQARIVQFLLILLDVALFHALVVKLFGSDRRAWFAVVAVCATVAYQKFYDGILGDIGLWPALTALLFASVLLFIVGASATRRRVETAAFAAALVCYICALLLNEVAIPAAVLFVSITLSRPIRSRTLGVATTIVVISALAEVGAWYIVGTGTSASWLRVAANVRDSTYGVNVLRQLVSGLPMVANDAHGAAHDGLANINEDSRFYDVPRLGAGAVVVMLVAVFAYLGSRREHRSACRELSLAAWLGALLWIGASISLAPQSVWPHDIPLGLGYATNYLEHFGFALLITAVVTRLTDGSRTQADIVQISAALAAIVFMYANLRLNSAVVAQFQVPILDQAFMTRAARAGTFDQLPRDAKLVVDRLFPYRFERGARNARYEMYRDTRKRFILLPPATTRRVGRPRDKSIWIIRPTIVRRSALTLAHWSATDAAGVVRTDRALTYEIFPSPVTRAGAIRNARKAQRGLKIETRSLGDRGLLTNVDRLCGSAPLALIDVPEKPMVLWGRGFYPLPHLIGDLPKTIVVGPQQAYVSNTSTNFRFFGTSGEMIVKRDRCRPAPIDLTLAAATASPATITYRTASGTPHVLQVTQRPDPFHIVLPARLASPIRITFRTDARAVEEYPITSRYEAARSYDLRVLIVDETAGMAY